MPISELELMEFFAETFIDGEADADKPEPPGFDPTSRDSLFKPPSEELFLQSRTLDELLGGQRSFLLGLAAMWERHGDPTSARVAHRIERYLAEHPDALVSPEGRIQRLGDYVYPVV